MNPRFTAFEVTSQLYLMGAFFQPKVRAINVLAALTDHLECNCCLQKTLNTEKSQGPNGIPYKILYLVKQKLSELLSEIFNISFSTGNYPDILKVGKVVPIHKKGSPIEVSNYRPITLLSNIDKILEKMMHTRLTNFLTKNNILFSKQFGFRKQHSTSHALLSLVNKLYTALDNGEFGCAVFIDLQKAFDTVDTSLLLKKLNHYGVRGIALKWFESYLTGRRQSVSINNVMS